MRHAFRSLEVHQHKQQLRWDEVYWTNHALDKVWGRLPVGSKIQAPVSSNTRHMQRKGIISHTNYIYDLIVPRT